MTKKSSEHNKSQKYQSTTEKLSLKLPKKLVFSPVFTWFWATLIFTFSTVVTSFAIPENSYPLAYIRLILGAIFILFIPGFCLIKMLFPEKLPFKTLTENLDKIERVILSICMSIVIVPIVGLLLNYTSWGIRLIPITTSLVVLTIFFALVAFIREYNAFHFGKSE